MHRKYYKQSATGVAKFGKKLLQSMTSIAKCEKTLLQSVTDIIKCDNYYKVRRNTGHKFGIGSLRYVKQIQILVL